MWLYHGAVPEFLLNFRLTGDMERDIIELSSKERSKQMENNYSEWTVEQLRKEMRRRELPQQENGKKYNKTQLIEKLEENDRAKSGVADDETNKTTVVEKALRAAKQLQDAEDALAGAEGPENTQNTGNWFEAKEGWVSSFWSWDNRFDEEAHARDLEVLREKYVGKTPEWVFTDRLKPGVFVAYIKELPEGKSRMRTSKVVGVNRAKRMVKVETYVGEINVVQYEEIMFVNDKKGHRKFPRDIRVHMGRTRSPREAERMRIEHEDKYNTTTD